MNGPWVDRTDREPGPMAPPLSPLDRRARLLLESRPIIGYIVVTFVALLVGCDHTAEPNAQGNRGSAPKNDRADHSLSTQGPVVEGRDKTMITEDEAIRIAKQEIRGKVQTQSGAPITVKLRNDRFEVTFVHVTPPGTLGPGYDARVTIEAKSGKVLQAIQGPN